MLCSLHVFMKLPSLVPDHIGTKVCPGLPSGIETSCHRIRHSRAGGNPRKAWVAELRELITDLRTRRSTESKVLPPLPRWERIEVRVNPVALGLGPSQRAHSLYRVAGIRLR